MHAGARTRSRSRMQSSTASLDLLSSRCSSTRWRDLEPGRRLLLVDQAQLVGLDRFKRDPSSSGPVDEGSRRSERPPRRCRCGRWPRSTSASACGRYSTATGTWWWSWRAALRLSLDCGKGPDLHGHVRLVMQRMPAPVGGPVVEVPGDHAAVAPGADLIDLESARFEQRPQPARGKAPVVPHAVLG